MQIHPIADIFPLMADDELDELAEDIKANGLINPIVVDGDGVLIDGRNRLEACRRAGVEPRFQDLNGADPVVFILSSNDKRRHMSKGARAMVAAKIRNLSFNDKSPRDQAAKRATCDEAEVALNLRHQTASARITELRAAGKLRPEGTRPTRSGRQADVLIAL